MVLITKPQPEALTRAKGTVNITSAGRRRDEQGNWVYAIQSSDPRKQTTDPYYTRVNAHTGEAIDCTCNDFLIWRERAQENCKHMDFASADCKAKLLDAYIERFNAAMHLLGNVQTFLDYCQYLYPGPLDASDIEEERERLLNDIQQQKGTHP